MRTLCLLAIVTVCAACDTAASRRFGPINPSGLALGEIHIGSYGFRAPMPNMAVDTMAQRIYEQHPSPLTHSYAFLDPATPPYVVPDHIVFTAFRGQPIDETAFTQFAEGYLKSNVTSGHDGQVLQNEVRWRPDTAEFRFVVQDTVDGWFRTGRCLASHKGRDTSVLVCATRVTKTPDAHKETTEGLMLIPVTAPPRRR